MQLSTESRAVLARIAEHDAKVNLAYWFERQNFSLVRLALDRQRQSSREVLAARRRVPRENHSQPVTLPRPQAWCLRGNFKEIRMHLQSANLYYNGSRAYEVKADDHRDLPLVFDFAHPEQCAIKALAVMSRASGGHLLRDCRVHVHVGRHTASITASGAAVQYAPRERAPRERGQPITAEQFDSIIGQTVRYDLGTVGQYGVVKQSPIRRAWRHDAPVRDEFGGEGGRDEFNSGRR